MRSKYKQVEQVAKFQLFATMEEEAFVNLTTLEVKCK